MLGAAELQKIGWIFAIVFGGAAIVFVIKLKQLKLKESGQAEVARRRKLEKKYVFYMNNVFTRSKFRRIVTRFATLCCYDAGKVKEESIKLFEKAMSVMIAMPIIALILLQNVILAALVILLGLIYYDIAVDAKIDKLYAKIVEESAIAVQSIRDNYGMYDNIPKSVLEADKGTLLDNPLTYIYDMLTSVDSEEMLANFKRVTPVRIIGTLATVCYIMNNEGDSRGSSNEPTSFESALTAIRREADTEVRRLRKTAAAFSSLKVVALIGLIATPFLDMFLLSSIPGTALYLKGTYGAIEKTLIVGITILTYYLISVLVRPTVVNQVDKVPWIDRLSKDKRVRNIIQNIEPKKFKTKEKLAKQLSDSISSKDTHYIYTLKPIVAAGVFLTSLLAMTGLAHTAKRTLWLNNGSLTIMETTQEMTPKLEKQLKQLDEIYMTQEVQMTSEEAFALVKAKLTGVSDMDALTHVDRLELKWKSYYKLGFKWYYIVFAYLFAVAGWFAPELSLLLRKKMVEFESTEDVMQLQTLMIALANTRMDVAKVLYWMSTESTVHKAPLHYAYLEFTSDPEMALWRLYDTVKSKDLKRMVSKLERAVYALSLRDAFNDILLDKEQSLVMSELLQSEVIESKKQYAKLIASLPTSIAVMGGFVLPILILGVVQLMNSLSGMAG